MKNREKYAEEIKNYNGKNFCREFIKPIILKRESCNGLSCERCAMLQMLWFEEEYTEPIIDWSKVYTWYGEEKLDYARILTNAEAEKWDKWKDLEKQGRLIELPCAVGDTVWELCKCVDGMYRVYPGTVKVLVPQGSIRRIKNESPSIWNLYATSEYTYMYKSFSDFGKTVFTTKEAAEAKLAEIEGVE